MWSRLVGIAVILLAVPTFSGVAALAQESDQGQAEALEAYVKMMTPNENHAFLKRFVGKWDVTTTAWMHPGAQPEVSSGTTIGEMILGGRFAQLKLQGTMFGEPFEGLQIIGYDNLNQHYVTFWIDTAGTGFYLLEGTRDKGSTTIIDTGTWPDPVAGACMKVRGVTRFPSPDEYTYELYMTGADGTEFKSLEYRALRKKAETAK